MRACWAWVCLVAYLPVASPGLAETPIFCIGVDGHVVVEIPEPGACAPLPVSAFEGCAGSREAGSHSPGGDCHCGPCTDIPIPVDQTTVRVSDTAPRLQAVVIPASSPLMLLSALGNGSPVRHRPPETNFTLTFLPSVVLLV